MSTWLWNLLIWGGMCVAFLGFEFSAIAHKVPWTPLSDAVWSTEAVFKALPWFVVAFCVWLMLHLVVKVWR